MKTSTQLTIILAVCFSTIILSSSFRIRVKSNLTDSFDCQFNGTLTKEERRAISLFSKAKKIKLISFSQQVVKSTPIDRNMLASKYLKEEITLTEDQIDSLTQILYNYNYSKDLNSRGIRHGSCYEPRHAIVFLNSTDKVFGYFEFCFTCENHETVPARENVGEFCFTKYNLLENFFRVAGITFFKETEEE